MKIVADEEIFALEHIFQPLGKLRTLPGRSIARRDLRDADALLVRSVLPVNRELLRGSPVRFVGTATSGTDHVDTRWLQEAGIGFAHARGANANAVVEYCLGAIARLLLEGRIENKARRIGIVGAGAIGGLLARKMRALGFQVCVCDPPRAAAGDKEFAWQSLDAALDCDIVSLHVPLGSHGQHATAGMIDARALARLRPGCALLHTCRGGVVDEAALLQRLAAGPLLHCVIDVWENEPEINAELAAKSFLATPHIAGYSEQAKWRAGRMLARALAAHFKMPQAAEPEQPADAARSSAAPRMAGGKPASNAVLAPKLNPELDPSPGAANASAHWRVIDQSLDLSRLSSRFTRWAAAGPARTAAAAAAEFDQMRRAQTSRREFSMTRLEEVRGLAAWQRDWLRTAGFQLPARR